MRIDRVKQSAVIDLDTQIVEKETEIARLEAETASSMWLADLEEFLQSWIVYSESRVAESVSVAKSDGVIKIPKKRKPVVVKK